MPWTKQNSDLAAGTDKHLLLKLRPRLGMECPCESCESLPQTHVSTTDMCKKVIAEVTQDTASDLLRLLKTMQRHVPHNWQSCLQPLQPDSPQQWIRLSIASTQEVCITIPLLVVGRKYSDASSLLPYGPPLTVAFSLTRWGTSRSGTVHSRQPLETKRVQIIALQYLCELA